MKLLQPQLLPLIRQLKDEWSLKMSIELSFNINLKSNKMSAAKNMYDTAIYVRVKRFNHTFFILCDEHEEVAAFKNRIIPILMSENLVKYDGDSLTVDDLKLCVRNRVSLQSPLFFNYLTSHTGS